MGIWRKCKRIPPHFSPLLAFFKVDPIHLAQNLSLGGFRRRPRNRLQRPGALAGYTPAEYFEKLSERLMEPSLPSPGSFQTQVAWKKPEA